jgi:hypothetical protein
MNKHQLIVNIAAYKRSYMLKFAKNEELIDKIKLVGNGKWDSNSYSWILGAASLIKVINLYKGRTDIFFKFFTPLLREKFIKEVQKALKKEAEELEKDKSKTEEYNRQLERKHYYESIADTLVLPEGFRDNFKPYPHQLSAAYFLNEIKTGMLLLDMGLGKAQPLTSPVLTSNGWVQMGDIKVGDKVINSKGGRSNVTGVYPQGVRYIFKVSFSDGSSTECCKEHLWSVNSATRNKRGYPHLTMSLEEIVQNGLQYPNGNNKWYIPIVNTVEFETNPSLPLDPYLLGCLLGDGHIGKLGVDMVCHDGEIIDELSTRLPTNVLIKFLDNLNFSFIRESFKGRNPLLVKLEELGLLDSLSNNKFIPNEYLYSSVKDRTELLQGLLDTDGSVYKDGTVQYFTVSEELMKGVKQVVQSLGGVCRVKTKQGKYKKDDGTIVICQLCYVLTINLPLSIKPFKLQRKLDRIKTVKKYNPARAIVNVEYVGKKEAQCISVDAEDHLYLTDDFIVTHNTLISIIYVEMQKDKFKKVLVVTPNSLKYNYKNEVEKFTYSKAYVYQGLDTKKGRKAELQAVNEAKYIIVNYEYFNAKPAPAVKKDKVLGKRYFDKNKKFTDIGLPVKLIDCVICDESHKLKNEEANTTRNFIRTLGSKENIVLMTGTPAPNRIEELYTALNMVAPRVIKTKSDYLSKYCGMKNDENTFGWVQDTPPKLEEIFKMMSPFSIRKKKEDVLKDLPEKQVTRLIVELSSADMKDYSEVEKGVAFEMYGEMKKSQMYNPLTTLIRLRQFTSMLKVKYMKEVFDRLVEEDEKFIVFDSITDTLRDLHKQYEDCSVLHIGEVDTLKRAELVQIFQEDDSCNIFFGSNQTCNAGLTLTASNKIFQMQQPYSVGENDQLNDRIHRIGQKNFCNIYIPVLKGTIDEMVFFLVESKRKELSLAIDNKVYERNRNQSFISDLINNFRQKYKGLD